MLDVIKKCVCPHSSPRNVCVLILEIVLPAKKQSCASAGGEGGTVERNATEFISGTAQGFYQP